MIWAVIILARVGDFMSAKNWFFKSLIWWFTDFCLGRDA
jgi:hypothetical protein